MAFANDTTTTWNEKFSKIKIDYVTGAALSETLDPGGPFQLLEIRAKFSASTTNDMTITLDANAGAAYDALLFTADFNGTSYAYRFDAEELMTFGDGDTIDFAWTDGAKTIGLLVVYRVPYNS